MSTATMRLRVVLFAVLFASAASAADDEDAPLLVVRSTAQCREAGPPPPFSAAALSLGVRFTVALPAENTCTTVDVKEQVLDDEVRLTITPQFAGQVISACEVVCSGQLIVTGWVRRAGLQSLTIQTPEKQLYAERSGASWVARTARVHFTSTPSDAAVFRGPRTFLGRTPLTVVDEPVGRVKYFLVKEQASAEVDVMLSPGETRRIRSALTTPPARPRGCDPVLDFDCPPGGTAQGESLSKTEILTVIKAAMPQIDRCAELHPTHTILKTTWSIRTDGRVIDANIADPRFADEPVGRCVLKVIKKLRFPKHREQAPPITFPFRLR